MGKITKIRKLLGTNVRFYRYQMDYSQEQLAEKCDLSTRYISDIETGKGNIPVDTLEIIAKVLKVDSYLLIKENNHSSLPKRVNMK